MHNASRAYDMRMNSCWGFEDLRMNSCWGFVDEEISYHGLRPPKTEPITGSPGSQQLINSYQHPSTEFGHEPRCASSTVDVHRRYDPSLADCDVWWLAVVDLAPVVMLLRGEFTFQQCLLLYFKSIQAPWWVLFDLNPCRNMLEVDIHRVAEARLSPASPKCSAYGASN